MVEVRRVEVTGRALRMRWTVFGFEEDLVSNGASNQGENAPSVTGEGSRCAHFDSWSQGSYRPATANAQVGYF